MECPTHSQFRHQEPSAGQRAAGPHDRFLGRRYGFTLIELLVTITIIAVLMGLLFPAIAMIRDRTSAAVSNSRVMGIMIAMQTYADEDPRHFFPTPAADERLIYDPQVGTGVLSLLALRGYSVNTQELDPEPATFPRALVDGWYRPIRYILDGPFRASGTIDTSAMNGTADRPAPLDDWNPKSVEPFTYVWSLGRPRGTDAADRNVTNAVNWIYKKGLP